MKMTNQLVPMPRALQLVPATSQKSGTVRLKEIFLPLVHFGRAASWDSSRHAEVQLLLGSFRKGSKHALRIARRCSSSATALS